MADSAVGPARPLDEFSAPNVALADRLSLSRVRLGYAGLLSVLTYLATAAVIVVLANTVVAAQHYPNYGTWTGIRPLEDKLRILANVTATRQPDAIVLGSSISDFGFNAEYFSQLVSQKRGVDFRAFNFSSGATEVVTLPKMYRLARTVARPSELLLVLPAGIKRANEFQELSPDYILEKAPVGLGLAHPQLLGFDKAFWDLPLVSNSTAIRDMLAFGRFTHLPMQGADLYRITESGDTLGFNYQVSEPDFTKIREAYLTQLTPVPSQTWAGYSLAQKLQYYFNDRDIAAMQELRDLTASDNVRITIVRHSPASTLYPSAPTDPTYYEARQQFFECLSEALGARVINDLEGLQVPQYAVNDVIHLNYWGARLMTARAAASYLGDPSVAEAESIRSGNEFPKLNPLPSKDDTVNQFASLLPGPDATGRTTLRLGLIRNHAVPALPPRLQIAVRLPDGHDFIVPAQRAASDVVEASFPDVPVDHKSMLLVRLLDGERTAINQPISDFAWVAP